MCMLSVSLNIKEEQNVTTGASPNTSKYFMGQHLLLLLFLRFGNKQQEKPQC